MLAYSGGRRIDTHRWEQAWTARDRDPALAQDLANHDPNHPYARVLLAYLQWRAGQLKTAQLSLAPALSELQQQGASVWYGRALNTAACLSYSLNRADEAFLHLEQQIHVARLLGDATLEAIGLHDLASTLRIVHPSRAEQYLHEAIAVFETIDEPLGQPLAYINLGDLQRDAGRPDVALASYRQALSFPEVTLRPLVEAFSLRAIIDMLELLGRPEAVEDAETRLRVLAATCPHLEVQAEAWLSLTRHAAPTDVIARLSRLPPLLEAEDNALYLPEMYQRLSEAYAQLGDDRRALLSLQRSVQHERAANLDQRQTVARAFERLLQLEEARRHNEVLQQLSQTDHLTGLANRLALFQQAERWAADQTSLSVALFDIDGFKRINDTWGHSVGDAVLIAVAHVLQRHAEPADVVARHGGDEFILVRPEAPALVATCHTIHEDIQRLRFEDIAPGLTVTMSVGVTGVGQELQTLIEQADHKLYTVKRNGKNAVASD